MHIYLGRSSGLELGAVTTLVIPLLKSSRQTATVKLAVCVRLKYFVQFCICGFVHAIHVSTHHCFI